MAVSRLLTSVVRNQIWRIKNDKLGKGQISIQASYFLVFIHLICLLLILSCHQRVSNESTINTPLTDYLEQSTEDNPKPTRQSARAAAKASAAPKPKPKSPPKATKKRKADDNDIEIDNDRKSAKRRQPALEQVGLNKLPQKLSTNSLRTLLVFGTGDFGQFGLGVDTLGEIKRPRIHQWVEDAIEDDELGPEGVEQIAAGGMHNLMIDSNGKVSVFSFFFGFF